MDAPPPPRDHLSRGDEAEFFDPARGRYVQCVVDRVRANDRYDVVVVASCGSDSSSRIEQQQQQRSSAASGRPRAEPTTRFYCVERSRLKRRRPAEASQQQNVSKESSVAARLGRSSAVSLGSRVASGTKGGYVADVRGDGTIDVVWDDGSRDVAMRTSQIERERRGKRDNNNNNRKGASVDVPPPQFTSGTRVSVAHTRNQSFPATIVRRNVPRRHLDKAAGAAPGATVEFVLGRDETYDVRYDEGGVEKGVDTRRLGELALASDDRAPDDEFEADEMRRRWRDRSAARLEKANNKEWRRGESVLARVDDDTWRKARVLRSIAWTDLIEVALLDDGDQDDRDLICQVDSSDLRSFGWDDDQRRSELLRRVGSVERPCDDDSWWFERGITSPRERERVAAGKAKPGEDNVQGDEWLVVAPVDLEVGSRVLAPRERKRRLGDEKKKSYYHYAPARVTRCYLDGTVDVAFFEESSRSGEQDAWAATSRTVLKEEPKKSTLQRVRPSSLRRVKPKDDDNEKRQGGSAAGEWRLRVDEEVKIVAHRDNCSGGKQLPARTGRVVRCHADGTYSVELRGGTLERMPRSRLERVATATERAQDKHGDDDDQELFEAREWRKAIADRVRAQLQGFAGGGDRKSVRSAFWPLSKLESSLSSRGGRQRRVVEMDALCRVLSERGLVLSRDEAAQFAMQLDDEPGNNTNSKQSVSGGKTSAPQTSNESATTRQGQHKQAGGVIELESLCEYVLGETQPRLGSRTEAAEALRRELMRCARRERGAPSAAACFEEIDINGDGLIDRAEFERLLGAEVLGARLSAANRDALFHVLDRDGDGAVSLRELASFVYFGGGGGDETRRRDRKDDVRLSAAMADEFRRLRQDLFASSSSSSLAEENRQMKRVGPSEIKGAIEKAGWTELAADGSRLVDALDVDGDGHLDESEVDAFVARRQATVSEEKAILRRFRARLARWYDSPLSGAELTETDDNDDDDGLSSLARAERDLRALNVLDRDGCDRDVEVLAACLASVSASVPSLLRSVSTWYRDALRGRWKELGSARAVHDVVSRLYEDEDDKSSALRRIVTSGRQQKNHLLSVADWKARVVPVLVADAKVPTPLVATVTRCMARCDDPPTHFGSARHRHAQRPAPSALTARSDNTVDLRDLLHLVDSEPVFNTLSRTRTTKLQHPEPRESSSEPPSVKVGAMVRVYTDGTRRLRQPSLGKVVRARANGRFDVELCRNGCENRQLKSRGDHACMPVMTGVRRSDLRPCTAKHLDKQKKLMEVALCEPRIARPKEGVRPVTTDAARRYRSSSSTSAPPWGVDYDL